MFKTTVYNEQLYYLLTEEERQLVRAIRLVELERSLKDGFTRFDSLIPNPNDYGWLLSIEGNRYELDEGIERMEELAIPVKPSTLEQEEAILRYIDDGDSRMLDEVGTLLSLWKKGTVWDGDKE